MQDSSEATALDSSVLFPRAARLLTYRVDGLALALVVGADCKLAEKTSSHQLHAKNGEQDTQAYKQSVANVLP